MTRTPQAPRPLNAARFPHLPPAFSISSPSSRHSHRPTSDLRTPRPDPIKPRNNILFAEGDAHSSMQLCRDADAECDPFGVMGSGRWDGMGGSRYGSPGRSLFGDGMAAACDWPSPTISGACDTPASSKTATTPSFQYLASPFGASSTPTPLRKLPSSPVFSVAPSLLSAYSTPSITPTGSPSTSPASSFTLAYTSPPAFDLDVPPLALDGPFPPLAPPPLAWVLPREKAVGSKEISSASMRLQNALGLAGVDGDGRKGVAPRAEGQRFVVGGPASWDGQSPSQTEGERHSSEPSRQKPFTSIKTQWSAPSTRGYATPPATPLSSLSVTPLLNSVADGSPKASATSTTAQCHQSFFGTFQQQCDLAGPDGSSYPLSPTLSSSQFSFHAPTTSWISYRRNFFSLSVSLPDLPTSSPLFTSPHRSPVSHLEISIEAHTTRDGTSIDLLQLDSARDFRNALPAAPQTLAFPDPPSSSESSSPLSDDISQTPTPTATFSRLQFQRSTANHHGPSHGANGERFIVSVILSAVRANGTSVEVGRWTSEPLIVRGRSPKNFVEGPRLSRPSAAVGKLRRRNSSKVGESGSGMGEKKKRSSRSKAMVAKPASMALGAKVSTLSSSTSSTRAGKIISWDDYEPSSLGVGGRTRSRDQRMRKESVPMETVVEEGVDSDGD